MDSSEKITIDLALAYAAARFQEDLSKDRIRPLPFAADEPDEADKREHLLRLFQSAYEYYESCGQLIP